MSTQQKFINSGLGQFLITLVLLINMVFFPTALQGKTFSDVPQPKNVILLIGDGMGENTIEMTKQMHSATLRMDAMPYQGYAKTHSFSAVTDSAAGATAIACGKKTRNGCVGSIGAGTLELYHYKNVTELAIERGFSTGIVTSDKNTGATPAGFSAHTGSRDNSEDITAQQLASDIDLIWTASSGLVNSENAASAGYTYIDNASELNTLSADERSFAQFTSSICFDDSSGDTALLSLLTEKAIANLDAKGTGFFLMVEGAHIDKYSHGKDGEHASLALLEFDKAVAAALDFAEADGNTIVIVTADHETGGIYLDSDSGEYTYSQGSHSSANVPLRIYGTDKLVSNGEIVQNTDTGNFISLLLGCSESAFPARLKKDSFC